MDPNPLPPLHLWCPRPFATYTPNPPCPPSPPRPPNAPPEAPPPPDARVLLDTWYVIKPGNTKEKVAFFVAHQCGAAPKVKGKAKGHWGGHSSKAKRRRRCHDPPKGDAAAATNDTNDADDTNDANGDADDDGADLISVADMVALVERRAALALQGLPRAVAEGPDTKTTSAADCSRVAEAVAQFESRHRGAATAAPNGLRQTGGDDGVAASPGEVRIAFRIAEPARAKDKITCDLYRLITPAPRGAETLLPNPAETLLPNNAEPGAVSGDPANPAAPHRAAGFHVDVVVTGVVDQCVFFGNDGANKATEETVRLADRDQPAAPPPPPPGELFGVAAQAPVPGDEPDERRGADPSLCRLYRHVSHDFLEIRFKIQRLLEPRQYMLLLPEHVMVKIFGYLPTRALAALKCCCHYFKSIIETFGVRGADSRWSRHPLYRDDPCKQCKKRYERGDVSLCRWHPKPYHHDLPYGRSYWMCCRRGDKEAPGCRVGLHDNNWVNQEGR